MLLPLPEIQSCGMGRYGFGMLHESHVLMAGGVGLYQQVGGPYNLTGGTTLQVILGVVETIRQWVLLCLTATDTKSGREAVVTIGGEQFLADPMAGKNYKK